MFRATVCVTSNLGMAWLSVPGTWLGILSPALTWGDSPGVLDTEHVPVCDSLPEMPEQQIHTLDRDGRAVHIHPVLTPCLSLGARSVRCWCPG